MDNQRGTGKRHRAEAYRSRSGKPPLPVDRAKNTRIPEQPIQGARQQQGYYPDAVKMKRPERRPTAREKMIYRMIIVALVCIFFFATYQVIHYLVKSNQAKQEEQMVQELIAQSERDAQQAEAEPPAATPEPTQEPTVDPTPDPDQLNTLRHAQAVSSTPDVLLKFTQALQINPDTVGQLQMGESINTYVVQRDNEYYLRRSFTGEYSMSGAIFLDTTCFIYPQSRVLIIHGHNMHDGTAFGKLSRFEDIDYLNEYPFIKFSTLYESSRYLPFAVVYYSVDPDDDAYLNIYQINQMTDQEFIQFINHAQAMSLYRLPVNVAATDNILMVTTCATNDKDMRFAIFAVKGDSI